MELLPQILEKPLQTIDKKEKNNNQTHQEYIYIYISQGTGDKRNHKRQASKI